MIHLNDHHNDHEDDSLAHVLRGLGEATPPAGLEQRTVAGVLARLATAQQSAGLTATPTAATPLRSLGSLRWMAAAAALAVAAGGAYLGLSHTPERRGAAPASPMAAQTHGTQTHATQQRTNNVGLVSTPHAATHSPAAAPRERSNAQPSTRHEAVFLQAEQEHAEDESAVVSHPAPPMPPTAEERLLLRFARRNRSQDLAQMSNEQRAAQEARDAAEFQAFFEPPTAPVLGESE